MRNRELYNQLVDASFTYSQVLKGDKNTSLLRCKSAFHNYKTKLQLASEKLTPIEITQAQANGAEWAGNRIKAHQQQLWLEVLQEISLNPNCASARTFLPLHTML